MRFQITTNNLLKNRVIRFKLYTSSLFYNSLDSWHINKNGLSNALNKNLITLIKSDIHILSELPWKKHLICNSLIYKENNWLLKEIFICLVFKMKKHNAIYNRFSKITMGYWKALVMRLQGITFSRVNNLLPVWNIRYHSAPGLPHLRNNPKSGTKL